MRVNLVGERVTMWILPVANTGSRQMGIELEPEGHWFELPPAQKCEIRFALGPAEFDLELELHDDLVLIHSGAQKEVWQNGERKR